MAYEYNKDSKLHFMTTFAAVPTVQVTPHIQSLRPGDEAVMSCRATGEPFPKVSVCPHRIKAIYDIALLCRTSVKLRNTTRKLWKVNYHIDEIANIVLIAVN